jgi:hypothetical protein
MFNPFLRFPGAPDSSGSPDSPGFELQPMSELSDYDTLVENLYPRYLQTLKNHVEALNELSQCNSSYFALVNGTREWKIKQLIRHEYGDQAALPFDTIDTF